MPNKPPTHRPNGWKPRDPAARDKRRDGADVRGYTHAWHKFRNRWLKANPLCAYCLKLGRCVEATVVDHIKPHRGDKRLFWLHGNHQSLCESCHNSIKQREEQTNGDSKSFD